MGSPIHFPPDYDDMPAFDYDTTYMAEINNRMKVPYKLGPTGEDFSGPSVPLGLGDLHRPVPMEVPDKIVVNGDEEHTGGRRDLRLDLDDFHPAMAASPEYVGLVTPPRTLTLSERPFPHLEDIDETKAKPAHYNISKGYLTPRSDRFLQELTAGEGDLVQDDDQDEVVQLQRQVAKLTRHVMKLEEESKQRDSRDLMLYVVISSYVLWKFASWFVKK